MIGIYWIVESKLYCLYWGVSWEGLKMVRKVDICAFFLKKKKGKNSRTAISKRHTDCNKLWGQQVRSYGEASWRKGLQNSWGKRNLVKQATTIMAIRRGSANTLERWGRCRFISGQNQHMMYRDINNFCFIFLWKLTVSMLKEFHPKNKGVGVQVTTRKIVVRTQVKYVLIS